MSLTHTLPCRPVALGAFDWLALHALALWPHGVYLVQRAFDGSDDPLGLLALGAVAAWVALRRHQLRLTPHLGWLVASLALALAANGAWWAGAPALAASLLAVLSLTGALLAWWPAAQPRAPLAGLLVLALPWIASLQFYAGWPLRVLTAQLSTWALQLAGFDAARSGASMVVNGQLVLVDAPCSGVQMAWLAYFTACTAAAALSVRDAVFLRRAAGVGLIVLAGNVLRNSVLVALESRPAALSAAWHEGVGLLVLAAVCTAVLALMARPMAPAPSAPRRGPTWAWAGGGAAPGRWIADAWNRWMGRRGTGPQRQRHPGGPHLGPHHLGRHPLNLWHHCAQRMAEHWPRLLALVLVAAALWPLAGRGRPDAAPAAPVHEWPMQIEGRALRPLALTAVEQRFAKTFPGHIGRFEAGGDIWVLRDVAQPTRMLHPAADCFRGLGYRVAHERLHTDAERRLWRCFVAEHRGRRMRVCERIVDAEGQAFVDASSWFWAAALGRSTGPWRAMTRVEPLT